MVRTDILNGLSYALSRGQSLKEAMMSMYNSGYPKDEIEEAARTITGNQFFNPRVEENNSGDSKKNVNSNINNISKPLPSSNIPQNSLQNAGSSVSMQKVSSYETQEEKNMNQPKKGKGLIIALVIILILLVVGVIGMFIFQDEVANFLSNIFG